MVRAQSLCAALRKWLEKVVYNGQTRARHAEVGKMSGKCLDSRVAESTTSRSMLSPKFVEALARVSPVSTPSQPTELLDNLRLGVDLADHLDVGVGPVRVLGAA